MGEGDLITVTLYYASRLTDYEGLNVSMPIIVQATPPPPTTPSAANQLVDTGMQIQIQEGVSVNYEVSSLFSVCGEETRPFFIFRRYEP
jgi:hypothetical protein